MAGGLVAIADASFMVSKRSQSPNVCAVFGCSSTSHAMPPPLCPLDGIYLLARVTERIGVSSGASDPETEVRFW